MADPDILKVRAFLKGHSDLLGDLRQRYDPLLYTFLLGKGANHTEAVDLLADFWADCVQSEQRNSLLGKFSERSSVKSWLMTILARRFFDLRRKQRVRRGNSFDAEGGNGLVFTDNSVEQVEELTLKLLRKCLQQAFYACPSEVMLMLQLVYVHEVTQRELARMWGWHESRISRRLKQGLQGIMRETLAALRQADPHLDFTWRDVVELCQREEPLLVKT